jgi:hypothetical protein
MPSLDTPPRKRASTPRSKTKYTNPDTNVPEHTPPNPANFPQDFREALAPVYNDTFINAAIDVATQQAEALAKAQELSTKAKIPLLEAQRILKAGTTLTEHEFSQKMEISLEVLIEQATQKLSTEIDNIHPRHLPSMICLLTDKKLVLNSRNAQARKNIEDKAKTAKTSSGKSKQDLLNSLTNVTPPDDDDSDYDFW